MMATFKSEISVKFFLIIFVVAIGFLIYVNKGTLGFHSQPSIFFNLLDRNYHSREGEKNKHMAKENEVENSRFKKICVYCGSQSGNKASYQEAAIELGMEMVKRRIDLVYGGGNIGLMGLVSQAVHDGGRHVLGIIPKSLMPREITGETIGEVQMVSNMHQRKAEMARQADAFIALPGGYGTLEELLEVITWVQLGIHQKPVGLLNVDGYYNSLLSFLDKAVDEGFISPIARRIVVSAPTAKQLVILLENEDVALVKFNDPFLLKNMFQRLMKSRTSWSGIEVGIANLRQ